MRVVAKLSGDVNCASSRIRFHRLLKYFPNGVNKFHIFNGFDNNDYKEFIKIKVNLLYVQKTSDNKTIKLVNDYTRQGIPIIYDTDVALLDGDDNKKHIVDKASLIIINVKDLVQLLPKPKRFVYIPDSIDYFYDKPLPIQIKENIEIVGTYWNGNNNIKWSKRVFDCIPDDMKKYYVAGCSFNIDDWIYRRWELPTFTSILKTFDLCVLVHPDDSYGNLKSPNRLLVAMALGIPCIISDTFSYREIFKLLNLENLIIDTEDKKEIKRVINKLKDKNYREHISKKLYNYVWKYHNPEMIAKVMFKTFQDVAR